MDPTNNPRTHHHPPTNVIHPKKARDQPNLFLLHRDRHIRSREHLGRKTLTPNARTHIHTPNTQCSCSLAERGGEKRAGEADSKRGEGEGVAVVCTSVACVLLFAILTRECITVRATCAYTQHETRDNDDETARKVSHKRGRKLK